MWKLKELIPEGAKDYVRLVTAKRRYRECYIGSPLIAPDVRLGKRCSISRGVELASGVVIGDASYVNCGTIIASGRIGKYCSIGPHSMIGLAAHPTDNLSTSPMLYGQRNLLGASSAWRDFPDPPVIGSDVWIGAGVFVKQGVCIGDGAIIGAGAVVTHDVPPYGIAAGVPARLLRYRFEPEEVKDLLSSPWWERSVAELALQADQFQKPWPPISWEKAARRRNPPEEVALP